MPIETVEYLAFVVAALSVFAAALAYADWATRHAKAPEREPAPVQHEKHAHRKETAAMRKAA